ncbi:hypothetical protein AG4045_012302, partial [Apium graveolens]
MDEEVDSKLILVMPENYSIERKIILLALGVELYLTDKSNGVAGISKKPKRYLKGHQMITGLEIWIGSEGKVDAFVAGIGTGGTITSSKKLLKEKNSNIK